jgi:hypothetical protein
MMQVIRLKSNYPEYRIKNIYMDNAAEFLSWAFIDYCMAKELKYHILFHMFMHKMVW